MNARPVRRSRSGRPFIWVVITSVVAFAVAHWLLTDVATKGPSSPVPSLPLPKLAVSDYENTRAGVAYVGSQVCVECHADQYESYLRTFHSRSLSLVTPNKEPKDGTVDYPLSHRRFEIDHKAGKSRHREILCVGDDEVLLADHAVHYAIGSGRVARTYASIVDGYLVESPVTWYASTQKWGMSPGYDTPFHRSFQRVVNAGCLSCHAGHAVGREPAIDRLQLHEAAIGCERCHGPGELHVNRRKANTTARIQTDYSIVNPKRLSRELGEAVCSQCHLIGDVSVLVRGREIGDFRPGLPLEDFRVDYRLTTASSEMTVVGHVEQLRQSRCYKESDTLGCTTCHPPHRSQENVNRTDRHRQMCIGCHASEDCTVPASRRLSSKQDDCVHCHMPQSPTEVQHVVFTHHQIGLHAEQSSVPSAEKESVLTPIQDVSKLGKADQQRMLGLAYSELFLARPNDPFARRYLSIADAHLLNAYQSGAADAAVLVAQANIAISSGNPQQAETLCELALTLSPSGKTKSDLLSGLGWIRFQQRRYRDAGRLFAELPDRRRDAVDLYMLGLSLEKQGLTNEAISAYERCVQIDPASADSHLKLNELYKALRESRKAELHRETATVLKTLPDSKSTAN